MADKQPPTIVEGATTGDMEDELPHRHRRPTNTSPAAAAAAPSAAAEDVKAASALASLDDDNTTSASASASASAPSKQVDHEAASKAMRSLHGSAAAEKHQQKQQHQQAAPKKNVVKVDQADVALLVQQLEVSKVRATDMLKACDGDAVKAMRAFVKV